MKLVVLEQFPFGNKKIAFYMIMVPNEIISKVLESSDYFSKLLYTIECSCLKT